MTGILFKKKILGTRESCNTVHTSCHCITKENATCKYTRRLVKGQDCMYRPVIELWVKTAGVRTMLSWRSRPFSWSYCSHPDSLIQRVPPGLQGTGPRGTASEPAPSRRASSGSRLSPILAFAGARRRPARRVSSSPGAEKRGPRTSSTAAHTSSTVGAHSSASSHRWNLGAQTPATV